MAINLHSIME